MFWANRSRAGRAVSVGVVGAVVAATALVVASPAQGDEIYARPWNNTLTLSGHGFGHGHGMSQYGAYGASLKGRTWQQIVDFYYPHTVRTQIGNPLIRVEVTGELGRRAEVVAESGLRATFGPTGANGLNLPLVESSGKKMARYAVTRAPLVGGVKTAALLRYRLTDGTWKTYKTEPSGQINLVRVAVSGVPTSNQLHAYDSSGIVHTYRAVLRATLIGAAGHELLVPIMALSMESYLRGVVPSESPASWPQAALAAQAVAARTYSRYGIDHPRSPGYYDTCDTTACQVFKGLATEPASTNAAIKASAGWALYYGSPAKAAFTEFGSSNGGWSADGGKPYLIAQPDPYDVPATDPVHTWTNSIAVSSIEARWPAIGSFQRLRIISRDGHGEWGGRVKQASIEGSAGSVSVTGATIRSAFGLRSEWFVPTLLRSAPSYPRDFSGDRKADVLALVAGSADLRMYAGDGASGWKSAKVIGTGAGLSKIFTAGTWDADALSDVMGQKPDGTLWLYPGTAADPLGPGRQIGSGWGIYNLVFPLGDFGGDGRSDLLARRPDGDLVLYSGNGVGGFLKSSHKQIGAGWQIFSSVFSPGDFDGDGKSDVLARTPTGLLYLYPGNGSGGWLPRRVIGLGWQVFSSVMSSGDFTGDGKSDLFARGTDGTLWMYPGNGTGGFLPRIAVGSGWNIFSTVLP